MNTIIKQLNRLIAVLALTSILPFVPIDQANAGFIDWLAGNENEASANQTLGSFANFLNADNQAANSESKDQELSFLQNSSLISLSSPLAPKVAAKVVVEVENTQVESVMTVRATAYSSTPDQTDDSPFITAMGTHVRDGIIAANFLPFGTKVKIPDIYGDKIFVVEDRMNRRYWYVVDIWFSDRASALEFGNRMIKIEILES